VALKTFTADRPPVAGDGKRLHSWHISAGAVAVIVEFCDGTAATPMFQVQVPINTSASQVYGHAAPVFPAGLHVELISGTLNRGCIDI
jgi:hypothetical protein